MFAIFGLFGIALAGLALYDPGSGPGPDDDPADDTPPGTEGDHHMTGGDGADLLTGAAGDVTLTGNLGNDILTGGNGADLLHGGAGHDMLDGTGDGTGDMVLGGAGDDLLLGGAADLLTGGAGADTFATVLSGTLGEGAPPLVTDFDPATDSLQLLYDATDPAPVISTASTAAGTTVLADGIPVFILQGIAELDPGLVDLVRA